MSEKTLEKVMAEIEADPENQIARLRAALAEKEAEIERLCRETVSDGTNRMTWRRDEDGIRFFLGETEVGFFAGEDDLAEQVCRLDAALARRDAWIAAVVRDVLRPLEFDRHVHGYGDVCPCCNRLAEEGHSHDCQLAKALVTVPGEGPAQPPGEPPHG